MLRRLLRFSESISNKTRPLTVSATLPITRLLTAHSLFVRATPIVAPALNSMGIRNVHNENVVKILLENPGKTLGEIYREKCDWEKYITKAKYDSLSVVDKDVLSRVLFTYTGYYALDKKFITVEEFLLIPADSREFLSAIFYDAEERYWEASNCREIINSMFKNKHFNLDLFISLSKDNREILIKLLSMSEQVGMIAVENGCFTVKEFLTLNKEQQETVFEIFNNYLQSGGRSYSWSLNLLDKIKERIFEFRNIHNDEDISNKNRNKC